MFSTTFIQLSALRWRHNGHDGVSNHQPDHCWLNRLFGCRSKKTSKLRVTGLCVENSPVTGESPAQVKKGTLVVLGLALNRQQAITLTNGPLVRYAKSPVAHAPGMPGTFSPPPRVNDLDMHQGTCVTHVPWWMPGSLTSGFLWNRWRGKRSRHSQGMRNFTYLSRGPWWHQ